MKKYTFDQVKDKFLGKPGSVERDQYEIDLRVELVGAMIKQMRKERALTQTDLGDLIGVQKSQISKLENNTKNISIGTIVKVFEALKANVVLKIELLDKEIKLT